MKNLSKHAEWLSLIEVSGPFLSVSLLDKAFPQGLEAVATPRRQRLRAAYEEWREAVDQEDKLLPELHRQWVRLVLTELLEYDHESLVQAADWPGELPSVSSLEHAGTFKPDAIVRSPSDGKPRLFIAVLPPDSDLESVQRGDGWPVSLQERMTLLCRAHGLRLGILTNGERWMLVNAPVGSTSGQASWYARLWFQEPITLKAFQSLLGVRRCFGPAADSLEALLNESLEHQEEVTDTLGEQVRRAVEVLVQCLDKADEDRNRELLRDVKPAELYEAGLTVMMRLVFVLCAEERGLLLLGDPVYDQGYAVSTLRGQLAEEADRHGPEVLDLRHDAWARLLALFRAVYGGIEHENLRMPALGGSLFDPDRFPFLEGRAQNTCWRDSLAAPLPIDNRTVLLLLNSLQILEQSAGALLLSYRALDVEQIGHVYEGLLEHTVARVPKVTLGLQGSRKAKNPNLTLAELESARLDGETALVELLCDVTGRSESAIKNSLAKPADDTIFGKVSAVCGGDSALAARIRPFTNWLRTDAWGDPIVYRAHSFMVTLGADRRETGTHYTPKSLTESIVTTTLEPLVYVGPAEGKPREEWRLKSSREILDLKVCDPAMGSGAFLVQVCRYLGEKLVESWLHEEAAGKTITVDGVALDQLGAAEPLPSQLDERLAIARRLVAERCLYGVDINPLAVELAKLSIWLVTLAKGRPFGFLDHNLRCGDSLLGIHRLEQLVQLRMDTDSGQPYQRRLFGQNIEAAVGEAVELRRQLREMPIRDIRDVEAMARMDADARLWLEEPESIADAFIGEVFASGGNATELKNALMSLTMQAGQAIDGDKETLAAMRRRATVALSTDLPTDKPARRPFHWPLEFPEVFTCEKGGFDALIGNPPFMGAKRITGALGESYREHLVQIVADGRRGNADLCAYFLLRAATIAADAGTIGMLATNTLSQGETRQVCLGGLVSNGYSIYRAIKSSEWPGKANLAVSIIWLFHGQWRGDISLDGKVTGGITPALSAQGKITGEPQRLASNIGKAFQGSNIRGIGFALSQEEAISLFESDSRNNDVVFPFLGGDDILSTPDQSPSRWVINFFDWDKETASSYIEPFRIAETKVLPERMKIKDETKRRVLSRDFWKYDSQAKAMYTKINSMTRYMVHPFTSKHHVFGIYQPGITIAHTATVIALNEWDDFAILQSGIHWIWALAYGNKLTTRPQYSPTTCFDTFPFPKRIDSKLSHLGKDFYEKRIAISVAKNIGTTTVHNMIDSPRNDSTEIDELRSLLSEIDNSVLKSYGWDDIDLNHNFYVTQQGVRFTFTEEAGFQLLQRLLELNHKRYEDEVVQGLHGGKSADVAKRKTRSKRIENTAAQRSLFTFDAIPPDDGLYLQAAEPGATYGAGPSHVIIEYLQTHPDWHAKADILTATGITDGQWNTAIADLIASGKVERQGEKRGARYRLATIPEIMEIKND